MTCLCGKFEVPSCCKRYHEDAMCTLVHTESVCYQIKDDGGIRVMLECYDKVQPSTNRKVII